MANLRSGRLRTIRDQRCEWEAPEKTASSTEPEGDAVHFRLDKLIADILPFCKFMECSNHEPVRDDLGQASIQVPK